MMPTRTTPAQIGRGVCNFDRKSGQTDACSVAKGASLTELYYQFTTSDIGYPSAIDTWTFSLIDLPDGVTYTATPIQRRHLPPNTNRYSGTPHTFITLSADNTAITTDNAQFTMRVCNASNDTKCQDIVQYLSITN